MAFLRFDHDVCLHTTIAAAAAATTVVATAKQRPHTVFVAHCY